MTKTSDKFTAEERALLINNGVVDAKTLNDLSSQKETLEQLRRSLAAIRASQQLVAQQQAHSSSDDTVTAPRPGESVLETLAMRRSILRRSISKRVTLSPVPIG